jgi:urease accessory protein
MNKFIKSAVLTGLALSSGVALAHPGHADSVGFLSGFLHPLSGLDHLFAIVLVSFWSAFALKRVWLGPALFMGGMLLGVMLGFTHHSIPWFEFGIALSILGMGILIYCNQGLGLKIPLGLIAIFGIFHGYAHSIASSVNTSMVLMGSDLFGLLIATALLHAFGVLLGQTIRRLHFLAYKGIGISAALVGVVIALLG